MQMCKQFASFQDRFVPFVQYIRGAMLIIYLPEESGQDIRPESFSSRIGSFFSLTNIITFALVFVAGIFPTIPFSVGLLRLNLPLCICLPRTILIISMEREALKASYPGAMVHTFPSSGHYPDSPTRKNQPGTGQLFRCDSVRL